MAGGIDNNAILLKSDCQFKGALTENSCLQQLRGPFNIAEHAPRFSKRGYRKDGSITNLPSCLARKTGELL